MNTLLQAIIDRWPMMLIYILVMSLFHIYRLNRRR